MSIFVDTTALVAIINSRDQFNRRAIRTLKVRRNSGSEFIIPRIALIEFLGHVTRGGLDKESRNRALDEMLKLRWPIEEHNAGDHDEAVSLWRRYADNPIEYPDCWIATTAQRLRCKTAWTYDNNTLGRLLHAVAPKIEMLGIGFN